MGTPQSNPAGYRNGSALTHAHRIVGRLLLVHGLIDENVHARHTMRLITALVKGNVPYDLLVFPEERHVPRSVGGKAYMETRIRQYFARVRFRPRAPFWRGEREGGGDARALTPPPTHTHTPPHPHQTRLPPNSTS